MLRALVESLRPKQWTKNLLLLAPLLFAQRLGDDVEGTLRALAAFAIFCMLSGAVYLFNDLSDIESDRLHPDKRSRPLASGRLQNNHAIAALVIIVVVALSGTLWLSPELVTNTMVPDGPHGHQSRLQPSFLSMALSYLALHVAYTFYLKRVVILDAMAIALGFVMRAIAGAAVIPVHISHWLLICTIFLSLFLAFAKRRHEIVLLASGAGGHRKTLEEYDSALLDQMIGVVASACLISYALYTMAPETIDKFGTDRLNTTIPFVIYGLFRYLYLIHRRSDGGDPSASLLADRPLLAAVVLWGAAVWLVLYL